MRDSLGSTPVSTRTLLALAVLTTTLGAACASAIAQAPQLPLPPPCPGNSTVYSTDGSLDTIHLHPAKLLRLSEPPSDFHGRLLVRVVVDPQGKVVDDIIEVGPTSHEDVDLLERWIAGLPYRPATLGACAVSSSFTLTLAISR